jgi:hypothetical protein
LVILSETNVLNLISQRLDTICQLKPKRAMQFLQNLEMTSEVINFLRGIFNMFDIDNVRRMYNFVFVKSNLTLLCNWYSMITNRYYAV